MSIIKRVMNTLFIIVVALIVLIFAYFFVLGQISKRGNPPGLMGDQLAKCSSKPNCVCSEYSEDQLHYIPPINIAGIHSEVAHARIREVMQSLGGKLQTDDKHYLAFTFSSALFGFVDDVEVRIDADKNAMHIRSASRVGYSDIGANRKRVEAIKDAFNKLSSG